MVTRDAISRSSPKVKRTESHNAQKTKCVTTSERMAWRTWNLIKLRILCYWLVRAHTKQVNCLVFTARRYASAVLAVIVCLSVRRRPSVCPSIISRSCTKTAKPRTTLTTPYDSPGTLVFRCQNSRRNSNDITPNGAPNRGGVGSKRRFSTNISLYLRNGAR